MTLIPGPEKDPFTLLWELGRHPGSDGNQRPCHAWARVGFLVESEGSDITRATWATCLRSKPARDLRQCLQWATSAPQGLKTALNSLGGAGVLRGRTPHPCRAPSPSEHREELAQRPPDPFPCQPPHSLSRRDRASWSYSMTAPQTLRHLPDEE